MITNISIGEYKDIHKKPKEKNINEMIKNELRTRI